MLTKEQNQRLTRTDPGTPMGQLFRRYNALVGAMQERESLAGRLAEEERLSSLGRLASGMAHDVVQLHR